MRIFKRLIGLLALLALAFVVIGFFLPRQVQVERSTQINAPASEVFPYLSNLRAGQEWSPWLSRDPEAKLNYSGPDAGVGARLEWSSTHKNVRSGTQEIIEMRENEWVKSALDFGGQGTATATFELTEAGDQTTVRWGLDADMGSGPVGRWMGLMMDKWVGSDYEAGLANLKALVEE